MGFVHHSSVERYDPALNLWEAVAPMVAARMSLGVAVLDGKLYAVGGYNDDDFALSTVDRYDPATNAWEAMAPMATARVVLAVAVLDGKLYAVGGESNDNYLSSVERYDTALNAWDAVAPMGTARRDHGVVVLDGTLYVVGGETINDEVEDDEFDTVEQYNPATNAWEGLAPMATARVSSPCVALL